jgi:hypothetical protein
VPDARCQCQCQCHHTPHTAYTAIKSTTDQRPQTTDHSGSELRGAVKKDDESDVYLPQPQKQSSHLLLALFYFYFLPDFFNRVLGRFVTRGVHKQGEKNKNLFGLVTKNVASPPRPFFFLPLGSRVFCSVFVLIAFLGVS